MCRRIATRTRSCEAAVEVPARRQGRDAEEPAPGRHLAMTFGRWLVGAALAVAPGLAAAQEGSGCGGFQWPLDHERAALVRPDKPSLANGGALAYDVATTLELAPLSAEAGLPKAPERAPKSPQSFAGHFALAAPAKPGVYKITISSEGWIDVLDGGELPASERVHRRNGVRGRAQERQVRPAGPPARAPVQRRRGRADFRHRLAGVTNIRALSHSASLVVSNDFSRKGCLVHGPVPIEKIARAALRATAEAQHDYKLSSKDWLRQSLSV